MVLALCWSVDWPLPELVGFKQERNTISGRTRKRFEVLEKCDNLRGEWINGCYNANVQVATQRSQT